VLFQLLHHAKPVIRRLTLDVLLILSLPSSSPPSAAPAHGQTPNEPPPTHHEALISAFLHAASDRDAGIRAKALVACLEKHVEHIVHSAAPADPRSGDDGNGGRSLQAQQAQQVQQAEDAGVPSSREEQQQQVSTSAPPSQLAGLLRVLCARLCDRSSSVRKRAQQVTARVVEAAAKEPLPNCAHVAARLLPLMGNLLRLPADSPLHLEEEAQQVSSELRGGRGGNAINAVI
jgi:hypothetical protein